MYMYKDIYIYMCLKIFKLRYFYNFKYTSRTEKHEENLGLGHTTSTRT